MKLPETVTICEVGPRDGLQLEDVILPTAAKVELIDRLSATGVPAIQATSFVRSSAVPQLADASEVMARIQRRKGVTYAALVPNKRGAIRALEAGVDRLDVVLSASLSHNMANLNMTIEESLDAVAEIVELATQKGCPIVADISTAFGCPFEGAVPVEQLQAIITRLLNFGIAEICLADTSGVANPLQVGLTFEYLMHRFPAAITWHLHTHDTRGLAIANVLAAADVGVTRFDASVGGLGGCPFAPGATGNVSTEDLVHGFEAMGVRTGIDFDSLLEASRFLQRSIGHALDSRLVKAGPYDRRYPFPEHVRKRLGNGS